MVAPPIAVRYLFADRGSVQAPRRVAEHRHPFWQLELFTAGSCRGRLAESGLTLSAVDLLLIPPGMAHAFDYHRPGCSWLSLKFALGGRPLVAGGLLRGEGCVEIGAALANLLRGSGQPPPPVAEAAGHLLAALLRCAGLAADGARRQASLPERAAALVEAGDGLRWTVGELARRLGVAPGHLSACFHAERGEALKPFIDRQRATCAEGLLADPSLGVAEVADLLGFVDAFAFSRFFKRVRGVAPSAWRQRR